MQRTREDLFEILVREHEPALAAFLRSCVLDSAAAEDLAQETFLAAWQQLDQYDENHPFANWLRGIARNKALAYYRSVASAGRRVRILDPKALAAVADQFDRLIPGRGDAPAETLAALRQCLANLSAADHEIVRRTYRDRQTCRAIADQLGHTDEAIKKRLQRARAQLRDCIISKLKPETARA